MIIPEHLFRWIAKKARVRLREDLADLREGYGVHLKMGREGRFDADTSITLKKLGLLSAVFPVKAVREEFNKYSPEYIRALNIGRLRLGKNLWTIGRNGKLSELGGATVKKNGDVYLSSYGGIKELRKSIHHELWHRHDQVQKLSTYRDWAGLNPDGATVYLRFRYNFEDEDHDVKVPGFAIRYGMMNEQEDRATIAEELMTNARDLLGRTKNDPVLGAKVARIMTDMNYCFGVIPSWKPKGAA